LRGRPKNLIKSGEEAGKKGLTLISEKEISQQGCRGQEFTLESPSEQVDCRGFIVGHNWITLAACHPKERPAAGDAQRFLKSLSLKDVIALPEADRL
jgi:hypothetical protein